MRTLSSSLLLFLLLFFACPSYSTTFKTRALIDKTYVRDNSYCRIGNKRIEVELRGFDRYTDPGEMEFGENAFVIHYGKHSKLPLDEGPGRYRFLKGKGAYCSKSLSLKKSSSVHIFFFLKDNRPLGETLSMVFYDVYSGKASLLETMRPVNEAQTEGGILKFSSYSPSHLADAGRTRINNREFVFAQKSLVIWNSYDGKDFKTDEDLTFKNFEYAQIFQNKSDFQKAFQWDETSSSFKLDRFFLARNFSENELCLTTRNKTNWICRKER